MWLFVHILCGYTRDLCGFVHILCGYTINLCGFHSEDIKQLTLIYAAFVHILCGYSRNQCDCLDPVQL